jgi:hypothetical protein
MIGPLTVETTSIPPRRVACTTREIKIWISGSWTAGSEGKKEGDLTMAWGMVMK